jgi:hypothetical protein
MTRITLIFFLAFVYIVFINSCKKNEVENMDTLKSLYKAYNYGEIDEGQLDGKIVFCGSINRWDSSVQIYSNEGVLLGVCSYQWGPVDPICNKLTNTKVIYRCKDHISGLPPIDIFNLANLK